MVICEACVACYINGVLCHEHGCPEAWRSAKVECAWCGVNFKPAEARQRFCDESCAEGAH